MRGVHRLKTRIIYVLVFGTGLCRLIHVVLNIRKVSSKRLSGPDLNLDRL